MKIFFLALCFCAVAIAGPDEEWSLIQTMEKAPQIGSDAKEARTNLSTHLQNKEEQLRRFIVGYPQDPRILDAQLKLAHLLAVRADLSSDPKLRAQAVRLVDELSKSAPAARKADVAFAQIALFMRSLNPDEPNVGQRLLAKVQAFEQAYPEDRRIAGLLAETAYLYDRQPGQKRKLLVRALHLCRQEDVRQRITDDLRRLDLMASPLELELELVNGSKLALKSYRGKIVVICFFAQWSPPSMRAFAKLKTLSDDFAEVHPIGISLDNNKESLASLRANWPLSLQTQGWESPLVRSLGINALPTLWVIDRNGFIHPVRLESLEPTLRQFLR